MKVERVEILQAGWTGDIWVTLYRGTDEVIKRIYHNPRPENIKRLTQAINKVCIVRLVPDGKSLYITAERLDWKPDTKPHDWDWVERWRIAQPVWYENAVEYTHATSIIHHRAALRAIGGMITMLDNEKAQLKLQETRKLAERASNDRLQTAIYQALVALDFGTTQRAVEILQTAMLSSQAPDGNTSEDIKDCSQ